MKEIIKGTLVALFLIYNVPFLLTFGLISLWEWDSKYLTDFGDKLISTIGQTLYNKL